VENPAIARVLNEVADLLELRGDNPFKIRAYRNAAATVADATQHVADLPAEHLLALPGIGKDIAGRIRELAETGTTALHRDLCAEFPASLLDLLRIQGLGPKTVALLYREQRIATVDQLEAAARAGQLRGLKGLGPKKEQLILRAIEEQRRFAGRHLLAAVAAKADAIATRLRAHSPDATIEPVGSLRRGLETCGDLDILVTGADVSIMHAFAGGPDVERVLGHGDTKSSVLLAGGLQADLRLVAPESRGAAQQYFTGSKAHNIALRDRAMGMGLRLNEYGLFRMTDESRVAGATEEGIYQALGLAWVPPELREHRGELEAAAAGRLPVLLERADLRGDLHAHTTESDGRDDLDTMVCAARDAGHEYVAITDHSQALAMANGLDERRALQHAACVRALNGRIEGITALAGIECDIRPDGTLDLADDCLAQLDVVVASVHSAFQQDASEMTERLLRAMANPWVDIIGHPTGRLLLRRDAYRVNLDRIVEAAAAHGVVMEINCQEDRLDLSDVNARVARDRGVRIAISTDAHARHEFDKLRWGVTVARRAWLTASDVINTRPLAEMLAGLRRNRRGPTGRG
jgi:DNA polymerase (family 10)